MNPSSKGDFILAFNTKEVKIQPLLPGFHLDTEHGLNYRRRGGI